jgi:hypothetical protein
MTTAPLLRCRRCRGAVDFCSPHICDRDIPDGADVVTTPCKLCGGGYTGPVEVVRLLVRAHRKAHLQ